jgi:hypothetical protein
MLVKISKSEKNAVEYACKLADLKVYFYSVETAPDMVQAEILDHDGVDPSRIIAFYLARQIEAKLACEQFIKK